MCPTSHRGAAGSLVSSSFGPVCILVFGPFSFCVFHHHGALLALYIPSIVSSHPVLPGWLGCGQVHCGTGCLDLVYRSVGSFAALVFQGVRPVSNPFPKFIYCPVVVESDFGGWHYPTKCHQVSVCDDVTRHGQFLRLPLVAWYGHLLVALRYRISLKLLHESFFKCPYRMLGLPLYRMSSWSILSVQVCRVRTLMSSLP